MAVFQKDPEVVAIGEGALRVQLVALFFQPMTVCANMMFQSIWKNGGDVACHVAGILCIIEKKVDSPGIKLYHTKWIHTATRCSAKI